VCLVTTGQPSTNPRAVKEADALAAAGYEVHVIGAHWADWADETDRELLASRPWSCELVRWRRHEAPGTFWVSRLRHRAARLAAPWPGVRRLALAAALAPVTPALASRARRHHATLFIAHNLGALPAAAEGAARWQARLAFDAEDFHSGQFGSADRSAAWRAAVEAERTWIPRCDYVTAAAPGIADAYRPLSRTAPVLIRNVFALADRPARRSAGSEDGRLRLYWFSQTIGPDRGLEDVVGAMGLLRDVHVELHLRGMWYGDYRVRFLETVAGAGVSSDRVIWHQPAPPREMVRRAADFDIGLALEPGRTRNSELAQSNKAFAYLAAGTPLLASDTAGHLELLAQATGSGWSYPRENHRALADLLGRLAADRDTVRRAGNQAWSWAERRFNWDLEQARFLQEVGRVAGGARRGAA
jgi:glycosyltransferase involved in cell wall biosynthesis